MLMRLVIRFAASLIGIAAGLLICGAVLTQFHIDAAAVVEATLPVLGHPHDRAAHRAAGAGP